MSDVIAIDGPSASGKSTVARNVANALHRFYVDSGAMYRGVTWHIIRKGIPAAHTAAILACLRGIRFELYLAGQTVRFRIDGEDPGEEIRSEPVRERVSEISAIPEVRQAVNGWLRETLRFGPVVMEGRDIGSVVFPEARFKFYLDADPDERARRRHAELVQRRESVDVDAVRSSLHRRDDLDSRRKEAPLRIAGGAEVIDTTGITIEAVVRHILARIAAPNGAS